MTYHHRQREKKSGAALVAVGLALVLIAGGALYGAYRFVMRTSPAAPEAVDPEVGLDVIETPFDSVVIDAGAFVMVIEVVEPITREDVARINREIAACLAFEQFATLYPEAEGRTKRVRVLFHFPPTFDPLGIRGAELWWIGANGRPLPLDAAGKPRPRPQPKPKPTPVKKPEPPTGEVDLVLENPDTGALVLVLVADDPWTKSAVFALRNKVRYYVDVVERGDLKDQLEDDQVVELQLHCRHRPEPDTMAALRAIRDDLRERSIPFSVLLVASSGEEEIGLDN